MNDPRPSPPGPPDPATRLVPTRRFGVPVLSWVVLLAIVVIGALLFRPAVLGGPVSYVTVHGDSMAAALHDGDLAVVEKASSYHSGEIVAYRVSTPAGQRTVVQRITGGKDATGYATAGYATAGDATGPDPWLPRNSEVTGKLWFHVPGALRWPVAGGAALVVVVLGVCAWPRKRRIPTPPRREVIAGPTRAAPVSSLPVAGSAALAVVEEAPVVAQAGTGDGAPPSRASPSEADPGADAPAPLRSVQGRDLGHRPRWTR
jgi:Peptidase S24-like